MSSIMTQSELDAHESKVNAHNDEILKQIGARLKKYRADTKSLEELSRSMVKGEKDPVNQTKTVLLSATVNMQTVLDHVDIYFDALKQAAEEKAKKVAEAAGEESA